MNMPWNQLRAHREQIDAYLHCHNSPFPYHDIEILFRAVAFSLEAIEHILEEQRLNSPKGDPHDAD